jgi:hypothetical protein
MPQSAERIWIAAVTALIAGAALLPFVMFGLLGLSLIPVGFVMVLVAEGRLARAAIATHPAGCAPPLVRCWVPPVS